MIRPSHSPMLIAAVLAGMSLGPTSAQPVCTPRLAPTGTVPNLAGTVNVLTSFDEGTGQGKSIFAATNTGVSRLTSAGWVSTGISGQTLALELIADGQGPGGGPSLYAGGSFSGFLARWTGSLWQLVTPAPPAAVVGIAALPEGQNSSTLYVVTGFSTSGLHRLSAGQWTQIATIFTSVNTWNERIVTFDEDGSSGPLPTAMYLCGSVRSFVNGLITGSPNTLVPGGVLRFDGATFTPLPSNPFATWIKSAVIYDDGFNGPALYISGHGSSPLGSLIRWETNSQAWFRPAPPSTLFSDASYGLDVLPDGLGNNTNASRLYAFSGTGTGLTTPNSPSGAFDGNGWSAFQPGPTFPATSLNYHVCTASGEIGPAHIPALVGVSNSGSSFFAIVGCPRCLADFDLDGVVTPGDLFAYLDAFFVRNASADLNNTAGITVQDLFDFISVFSSGCN